MHNISAYCHTLITPYWTYVKNTYKKIAFKFFAYPIAEIAGGYAGNLLGGKALQVLPGTPLILLNQSLLSYSIYKTTNAAQRTILITTVIAAPILYSYLPEETQEDLKPLLKWLFYLPLEGLGGYLFRRAVGRSDPHLKPFLSAKITGKVVDTLLIPTTAPFWIVFPLQGFQKALEIQAYNQQAVIPFTDPLPKSEKTSSWPEILLLRYLGKEAFQELKAIFQEEKEKQLPALLEKLEVHPDHPLSLLLSQAFHLSEKASHIHKSLIFSLIFSICGELRGIEGGEALGRRCLRHLEPHSFSLILGTGGIATFYALKTNHIAKKSFLIPLTLFGSYVATALDPDEASKALISFIATTSLGIVGGWATLRFLGSRSQLLSLKSTEFAATYGAGMIRLNLVALCFKLYTPPAHPLIRAATDTATGLTSFVVKTIAYNTHHIPSIASTCSALIKNVKNGIPKKALISSILNQLLTRYYGEFKPHIYPLIKTFTRAQKNSFREALSHLVANKALGLLQPILNNEDYLVPFMLRSLAGYSHLCTRPDFVALYHEDVFDCQKLEDLLKTTPGYSLASRFLSLPESAFNSSAKEVVKFLEELEISLWGFSSLSIAQKKLLEKTLPLYFKYYFFFILHHAFDYKKALSPAEEEAIFSLLLGLMLKASPSPIFWALKAALEKVLTLHRTHVNPTLRNWVTLAEIEQFNHGEVNSDEIERDIFKPEEKKTNLSLPPEVENDAFAPQKPKTPSPKNSSDPMITPYRQNYFQ